MHKRTNAKSEHTREREREREKEKDARYAVPAEHGTWVHAPNNHRD